MKNRLLPSLCVLALSACASSTVDEASVPTQDLVTAQASLAADNGGNLNGGNLNGGNLNGGNLNGGNLNGTDLSQFLIGVNYLPSALVGNKQLDSLTIEGTSLVGYKNGTRYDGSWFIGADLRGTLGSGATIKLRVDDIQQGPAANGNWPNNTDLSLYFVSFFGTDNQWHPACRDYTGAPVYAMALPGRWDYRMGEAGGGSFINDPSKFTFACMGGAIAKCVLFGYRPWSSKNGESLAPYHQACTRLIRGDYCGDGDFHTQNGNRVNLYDPLNIQTDTEDWAFEALWDENGARCIYPLNRSHAGIPCYDDRVDLLCGQSLGPNMGVKLTNETPTAGLTP